MRRFFSAILFLVVLAGPVLAQEEPDCSIWTMEGIGLGITLEQAKAILPFEEFEKLRHPSLDYRRYVWEAEDRPEKVELHVDMQVDPPIVMGVTIAIPSAKSDPREYFMSKVEVWGKPDTMARQGAFNLYTWNNSDCDVTARMSVMNKSHKVGVWAALTTFKALDEVVRRKRVAFPDDESGDDTSAAADPEAEPSVSDAKRDDD